METDTFHDFESFAASLQHVDLQMTLTYDRGQRWIKQQANLNRINIQYGCEGGGTICEGANSSDCIGVFVPMKNSAAITCNGIVCDDNSWSMQVPGSEFCHNVTGSNEWVAVFIPLDLWAGFAADHRGLQLNRLIHASPPLIAKFRNVIVRYMAINHCHSRFLEIPSIVESIEAELLSVIFSMAYAREERLIVRSGRPSIPRERVISDARRILEARSDSRLETGKLAAAAGVSERTLRNIFNDYYGVAPLRYLKLRRLHQVRNALKQADRQHAKVAEVAAQFGIWELGRFAQDYRRLFGETPSQTLRRNIERSLSRRVG
jgi:AraC family transcriptional regulator, ethanolamine operon transcriptional activator